MRENIFITKKQVLEMKQNSDERLKKLVEQALILADEGLENEALTEDKVRYHGDENNYQNQHEYYYNATRPFVKYMPCLGFAYYYTGDKKYFEKARELMLMYAGYERWHGKGAYGKAELVTAEFCNGMACGYEFFKECFEEKEIKYIAAKTYELGILPIFEDWVMPGTKLNALDTMGHNWWIWCMATGGLTSLVFLDYIPGVFNLPEMALKGLQEWLEYKGNEIDAKPVNVDNGAYYESVMYFLIHKILQYETVYKKITGKEDITDNSDIYEKAAEYYLNTFYPSTNDIYTVPFGDMGDEHQLCTPVYEFIHSGIKTPELRWYVQQCKRHKDVFCTSELFYYNDIYNGEIKKPDVKNIVYENIGWAIFRDSNADNANMLAVKCGDTWNHAHADAGTFVFYFNGEDIISEDSHSYYGANAYLEYIVTSKAHNVVLYNDEGQHHMDFHNHARNKGRLYNFTDEVGFKYVAADYTGPMGRFFRRALRHFLWLDDFVVIYDDITAYEPGKLSFLLHAKENAPFKMLTDCESEKRVIYKNNNIIDDPKLTFTKTNDISDAECMVYSVNTDENCRGKFVSVICLNDKISPDFTEIEDGCRIKYGDTYVYINYISDGRVMHKNCINVMDGITTDAVMLVDKKGKYGVVNGSMVRKDGVSYHDTLYRTNGWV